MSWAVLENLKVGASVRGLTASGVTTVESVQWIGELVAVAKHGRPVVVVMSVEEFERLKALAIVRAEKWETET